MSDLNQFTLTGRLGSDPEVRRTQAGKPIVNMRVAVSETWRDQSGERKEKTEWISAVIFSEGLCKVAEQYLKKGSKVLLQGKIATRKWQDQNGNDKYSTELVLQGFDAKLIMLDPATANNTPKDQKDSYGNPSRDLDDMEQIPF